MNVVDKLAHINCTCFIEEKAQIIPFCNLFSFLFLLQKNRLSICTDIRLLRPQAFIWWGKFIFYLKKTHRYNEKMQRLRPLDEK